MSLRVGSRLFASIGQCPCICRWLITMMSLCMITNPPRLVLYFSTVARVFITGFIKCLGMCLRPEIRQSLLAYFFNISLTCTRLLTIKVQYQELTSYCTTILNNFLSRHVSSLKDDAKHENFGMGCCPCLQRESEVFDQQVISTCKIGT